MIQIVAQPSFEPPVNNERLYSLKFKIGSSEYMPLMNVHAKTAALAEEKLFKIFEHELIDPILTFEIEKGCEDEYR